MRRLLSLKEWITLDETAEHLSFVFSEPVTVADLYRFALAGHLVLTAHFVNHGVGNLGKKLPIREAGFKMMPGLMEKGQTEKTLLCSFDKRALPHFEAWVADDPARAAWLAADEPRSKFVRLRGMVISDHECVQFEEKVSTLEGLWDLSMLGAERLDIEHALQQETHGPAVELIALDGVVVFRPDGTYARVLEHMKDNEYASEEYKKLPSHDPNAYYPAGGLPPDAPIVVRPSELARFVAKASVASGPGEATEKPLSTRERNNLLRIIAALAKEANVDTSEGGRGALVIEAAVAAAGFDGPKEGTIRPVLKDIRGLQP